MSAHEENARLARYARMRDHDTDSQPDPEPKRPKKPQVYEVAPFVWEWHCTCSRWPNPERFATHATAQASLERHLYFGTFHRSSGTVSRHGVERGKQ